MTQPDPLKLLTIRLPLSPLGASDRRLLERYKVGGVCLFRGEFTRLEDTLDLLEQLFELLGPHTLISMDQEGGSVVRLPQLPVHPGGFALASADDPELTYQVVLQQARALRATGINVNLGPVLDINNNPQNPVIADRALGLTFEKVIRHALPYIRAHQDAGILAVGKHYPGHGDTAVDSHLSLPILDKDFAELEQLELRPFRAAFAIGLEAVMTAHITFPRISKLPATLSPEILGYLRREMKFDGLIFTDALDMKAVVGENPAWKVALQSLEAGADNLLVLDSNTLEQTLEHFQPTFEQMRPALERFERTVQKYPFKRPERVELAELVAADRSSIAKVARKATMVRGFSGLLDMGAPTLFLVPPDVRGGGANDSDSIWARLHSAVGGHFTLATLLEYNPENANLNELETALERAEAVVFVTAQRTRLLEGQKQIATRLKRHPRAVHANLWNPFLSLGLLTVYTYGFGEANVQALIYALEHGEFPGTLELEDYV